MNLKINQLEDILAESAIAGDYTYAITEFTQLYESNPTEPLYSFYLGLLMVRTKNYHSGIRYLEQAKSAKLDPGQRLRCLVFLGKAYADVKAYSKAERAFREALQTGVPEAGAYSALGAVFYERKMVNQAIDALNKALEIDPNYAGAINNLGYILIESKKDIEKGISLCRKAVELDPENPAYRDSLGQALMSRKLYHEAQGELEKAMELSPANEIIMKRYNNLLTLMEDQ
ncbi:MAG: tetratricopeptide repeat protein [Brevinema sp.]